MKLSSFHLILLVGLLFKASLFLYFTILPEPNAGDRSISTLEISTAIDYSFYRQSLDLFLHTETKDIVDLFVSFYVQPTRITIGPAVAGPVFPTLIYLFNYHEGNTLPFYFFFLVIGSGLFIIWLRWLHNRGVGSFWLLAFALTPNPIYYMMNPSTEIPFAFLFALFYIVYFKCNQQRIDIAVWVTLLCLLLLTRPNGYSILLFVFLDFLIRARNGDRETRITLAGLAVLLIIFTTYLYPYFGAELGKSGRVTEFFGISQADYFGGLFKSFPIWIDLPLSWLSLASVKTLYFLGFRPSYSDVAWSVILARSSISIILLPGLIFLLMKGGWRNQLLVVCYTLPIFLGSTQDRYNLALQPILFFFGIKAIESIHLHLKYLASSKITQ